ncbi:MAG: hypothetical protein KDC38_09435, partial [Planctomycetes bacterium]|nr:hypothetical protein [Planctomycetota bacterium]
DLTATEQLTLHDVTFAGPREMRGRFGLTVGSIHAHGHAFANPHLAFDFLGGVAVTDMQAVASSNGARDRSRRTAFGPELGVGISIYPIPFTRIYGRALYQFGLHAGDETELQKLEAGAAVELLESLTVFGAWRLWRYRADEGGAFHTDVDIDAQGPVIGVEFDF